MGISVWYYAARQFQICEGNLAGKSAREARPKERHSQAKRLQGDRALEKSARAAGAEGARHPRRGRQISQAKGQGNERNRGFCIVFFPVAATAAAVKSAIRVCFRASPYESSPDFYFNFILKGEERKTW